MSANFECTRDTRCPIFHTYVLHNAEPKCRFGAECKFVLNELTAEDNEHINNFHPRPTETNKKVNGRTRKQRDEQVNGQVDGQENRQLNKRKSKYEPKNKRVVGDKRMPTDKQDFCEFRGKHEVAGHTTSWRCAEKKVNDKYCAACSDVVDAKREASAMRRNSSNVSSESNA